MFLRALRGLGVVEDVGAADDDDAPDEPARAKKLAVEAADSSDRRTASPSSCASMRRLEAPIALRVATPPLTTAW